MTHLSRLIKYEKLIAHTDPIFKKLNLLNFRDKHMAWYITRSVNVFVQLKNSIFPQKFENIFVRNNQIHSYNTRHANSFCLPLCRTNIRQFSVFPFKVQNFFNSLTSEITASTSVVSFRKKKLKYSLSTITDSIIDFKCSCQHIREL